MKLITTVMKPFKLDEVREALMELGLRGMTATEVKGFGRQKGQAETYRGSEYDVSYLPKIKLEIIVADDDVEAAISVIQGRAHTGRIGDGKIFVVDCTDTIRIRTGERGTDAL